MKAFFQMFFRPSAGTQSSFLVYAANRREAEIKARDKMIRDYGIDGPLKLIASRDGGYGQCKECGEAIPKSRLDAVPLCRRLHTMCFARERRQSDLSEYVGPKETVLLPLQLGGLE